VNVLILATIQALVLFSGITLSLLIARRGLARGERVFLSWTLGAPAFTFLLFLVGASGIRIGRPSIFLAALTLGALALAGKKIKKRLIPARARSAPWDFPSSALLLLVLALAAAAAVIGLYWPANRYDAMDVWTVRGMGIAATGSLSGVSFGRLPFYPPNVSLGVAAVYSFAPSLVKLDSLLAYVSLLGLFYAVLRRDLARCGALFFTLLLATVPYLFDHATRGFADLPFALYLFASTVYLLRFLKEGDRGILWLSGWLTGMGIWTKAEGWWLLIVNALFAAVILWRRKRLRWLGPFLAIALLGGIPWNFYSSRVLGYDNPGFAWAASAAGELTAGRIDFIRLKMIAGYVADKAFRSGDWGLLAPVCLALTLLFCERIKRHRFLLALLACHLGMLLFVYYGNPLSLKGIMHQTMKREFLHLLPLVVYYMALVSGEDGLGLTGGNPS